MFLASEVSAAGLVHLGFVVSYGAMRQDMSVDSRAKGVLGTGRKTEKNKGLGDSWSRGFGGGLVRILLLP